MEHFGVLFYGAQQPHELAAPPLQLVPPSACAAPRPRPSLTADILRCPALPPVAGLGDGPWASLEHLDLHGSSICDLPDSLVNAQRLGFLGLACCHSLQLDRWEGLVGRWGCTRAGGGGWP